MNSSIPQEALNSMADPKRQLIQAPDAFFQYWKRGVEIAGPRWFGDGTRETWTSAASKSALRPNVQSIAQWIEASKWSMPRESPEAEYRHLRYGPEAFLSTYKRGVQLAGPHWFNVRPHGTRPTVPRMCDMYPRMTSISESFDALSSGERMFLAALVSHYDAEEAASLLRRCGFDGLSDLVNLDLPRRQIIADLIIHQERAHGSGQELFLAAMVSIYNSRDGGVLLRRCGFRGLRDLLFLDLPRREVIAGLVVNYCGW